MLFTTITLQRAHKCGGISTCALSNLYDKIKYCSIVIGNPIIMCYTYCRNESYIEPYIACVYTYLVVARNATHYQ